MFLVALTTREVPDAFGALSVQKVAVGAMMLTIVVDERISAYVVDPDRVTVFESPTLDNASRDRFVLSHAVYEKGTSVFNISRPTTSGRSIYTHLNELGDFYCSTHISLLRKAGVPVKENTSALPELFAYRHVMPPRTMYLGIQQLRFGGRLQLHVKNGRCIIHRTQAYEPPRPRADAVTAESDAFNKTYELLEIATAQLGGDAKNLAVLLSGGLDSSILYKICKSKYDLRRTFSTGYPFEPRHQNREKEYALSAAKAFDARHTHFQPSVEEFLHGLIDAVAIVEEPLKHIQSVLLHTLFKDGIPDDRRLVICGQGAGGVLDPVRQILIFKRDTALFRTLSTRPIFDILKILSRLTGRGSYWMGELDSLRRSQLPIHDARNIFWDLRNHADPKWVSRRFGVTYEDFSQYEREEIRAFADRSYYDTSTVLGLFGNDSVTPSHWSKLAESQGKLLHFPLLDSNVLNYALTLP